MNQDFFKTKSDLLEDFCRRKGFVSKADLMDYGCKNFYLRAWRTVCDFVVQGKMRKLSKEEASFRGFNTRMAIYEWLGPAETDHPEIRRANHLAEQRINMEAV